MTERERWERLDEAGKRLSKLAKLKLEGLTMEVIAIRLEMSRTAVYELMKAADVLERRGLKMTNAAHTP